MRRNISSYVAYPSVPYLLRYILNGAVFLQTFLHMKGVFLISLPPFFLKNFSFQEEMSEIWSKIYIDPHLKWGQTVV